jgi:predicted amidohydrolase
MKPIPRALWDNRHTDPAAIDAALTGASGRAWVMRWLPSRAHDNGLFVLFANGVGVDDDEIRTGHAMILDPYGRTVAESDAADDALVVADLDLSLIPMSTGRRWLRARRPDLYRPLTIPTGDERDTRSVRFNTDPPGAQR